MQTTTFSFIEYSKPPHLVHQLDITSHKALQRTVSLLNHLRERIRHQLRSILIRVRVILGIKLVRALVTQFLERLRRRRKVVNIRHALNLLRNQLRIPNEPRRSIVVHTTLPLVVRRLTAHNNLRALGNVRPRGVADVLVESVDLLAGFAGRADLVAGAGAVAAAVVVGVVRRAAVVVAELDDYDVVGFEQGSDLGEAAFVRVAAGGAAADGFVDDGGVGVEEGGDVGAPAWRVLLVSCSQRRELFWSWVGLPSVLPSLAPFLAMVLSPAK